MKPRRHTRLAAALVIAGIGVAGLGVAGCARVRVASDEPAGADVTRIEGSAVSRVTLTADAIRNLGVKTQPVAAASPVKTIPITALIYDPQGKPWTYTMTSPRTFVRMAVVVQRIAGGVVYLSSGPAVGTPVVTVGASELLGSEYGVGGE
jgi:hypothetical protein